MNKEFDLFSIMSSPKKLMEHFIDLFAAELNKYSHLDDFPDPWSSYSERPMLGFFTTGIIRKYSDQNISALQDFNIRDFDGSGRSDLYLVDDKNEFLFEAKFIKCSFGIKDWNKKELEKLNADIFSQLEWYEKRTPSTNRKKRYYVSLVFFYIHNKTKDYFTNVYSIEKYKQDVVALFDDSNSGYFYKKLPEVTYTKKDEASVINSCLEIWGCINEG